MTRKKLYLQSMCAFCVDIVFWRVLLMLYYSLVTCERSLGVHVFFRWNKRERTLSENLMILPSRSVSGLSRLSFISATLFWYGERMNLVNDCDRLFSIKGKAYIWRQNSRQLLLCNISVPVWTVREHSKRYNLVENRSNKGKRTPYRK